ncbi:MAG: sarcosine oxidase subunit delta [Pseudomonadota bacterium]
MRIRCPHCGERDLKEFTYGGDASVSRPDHASSDTKAFEAFIHHRTNPAGRHAELWHHTAGCRQWLVVVRDTVTHDIESVEMLGPWGEEAKPRRGWR